MAESNAIHRDPWLGVGDSEWEVQNEGKFFWDADPAETDWMPTKDFTHGATCTSSSGDAETSLVIQLKS